MISQKLPGGRERQIAEVRKESRFASATAFLTAAFTNADNYMLHIRERPRARRAAGQGRSVRARHAPRVPGLRRRGDAGGGLRRRDARATLLLPSQPPL